MDISNVASQVGNDYQVAVQKQALDAMKVQGAQVTQMIASAGSVNSPAQGKHIDAWA